MKLLTLTKPGIIFGNVITACGGFFFASHASVDFSLLALTLLGIALVIASGCVYNNYIDADIDRLMERTKSRPTAKDEYSTFFLMAYATLLGVLGVGLLVEVTNTVTVLVAVTGLFFYVVVYSLWCKRTTVYGTLIGGISGAVPPVVGYCAITGRLDMGALILFLILFSWQVPHSYAIAIGRLKDYTAAKIPVLPVVKGVKYTKMSMLLYLVLFVFAAVLPTLFGFAGFFYFIVALVLGLIWFGFGVQGFWASDDRPWARKMLLFSVINITLLSFLMLAK